MSELRKKAETPEISAAPPIRYQPPLQPKKKTARYVVEEIQISLIDYAAQQVRTVQVDDEIHELASSIDALDLLQFPGVVRAPEGRFQLAWGRRRLEAFKLQRKTHIPCRIYEGTIEQIKALALVENMQRRQMSIVEECDGITYLVEEQHLSIDQIVTQLGRSRSWVLSRLAVPSLPTDIRDALIEGTIALGAAEELALVTDDSARAYLLNQTIYSKLTVSDVRRMVQAAKDIPPPTEAIQAGMEVAQSVFIAQPQLIACAACNTARPLGDLVFVRVCANGCPQHAKDDDSVTH